MAILELAAIVVVVIAITIIGLMIGGDSASSIQRQKQQPNKTNI